MEVLIPIERIILEPHNRKNLFNEKLTDSIRDYGILTPLYVEGDIATGQAILVDGYRRYASLEYLKSKGYEITEVRCTINPITSELSRQSIRARLNLTTKKMNGYDIERLIRFYYDKNWDAGKISIETGIDIDIVERFLGQLSIDRDTLRNAENNRAGRVTLGRIHELPHLSANLKKKIEKMYSKRDITGCQHVELLKRICNITEFSLLPSEDAQEKSIMPYMNTKDLWAALAERSVFRELLRHKWDELACESVLGEIKNNFQYILNVHNDAMSNYSNSEHKREFTNEITNFVRELQKMYREPVKAPQLIWTFGTYTKKNRGSVVY